MFLESKIHLRDTIRSVVRLLPTTTNRFRKITLCDLLAACEVTSSDLGVNLDAAVRWDEMVGDVVALVNWNAGLHDSVVLPVVTA